MRVVIADDEAPARAKLRKLLAAERDVVIAGEAADGEEAVAQIGALRPDVVFLDIRMPKLDGFGVVDAIGAEAMALVVFVTAYDEYALRAFEVHAADYLLKPYAPTRFRNLLDHVRARLARDERGTRIDELLASLTARSRYAQPLLVKAANERELLLAVERIDVIRADRNVLRIVTADGEYVRRMTMGEILARLDPDRFLRINRSEIVRVDAIRELNPWFHGDCRVTLHDGTTLMWSRRYRTREL